MKKSVALMLLMTMAMSFAFLFVGCEKTTYTDNQAYVVKDWTEVQYVSKLTSSRAYSKFQLKTGSSTEISAEEYTSIYYDSQQFEALSYDFHSEGSLSTKKQESINELNAKIGKYVLDHNGEHYYKYVVTGYTIEMLNIKLYSNDYMEVQIVKQYYGNIEKAGTEEVISHKGMNLGDGTIEYFI